MKPKRLTLCGWGPYKGEEKIDFTVFEEKGSVRSDFAEAATPTFVELVMEHGAKTYLIRRNPEYLRPRKRGGGAEGYTKEKENAILRYPDGRTTEGVKEVNAALREILVLDYQQFKKISMIAQGEFSRLLVASPRDKTRIFREIFDTGVFERFTQSLGMRARAAYARVSEQKHKLEEDVGLLLEGLEDTLWSHGAREELLKLTPGENWNYGAILALFQTLQAEAEEALEKKKHSYEKAENRLERQKAEISGFEDENRRILQLRQVCLEKEKLEAAAPEYAEKQDIYENALRAAEIEKLEVCYQNVAKQLSEKKEALEREKEKYLKKEQEHREKRTAFDEAQRRRRMNLIGMTAQLLEEGKPCPVCGSLHHPKPARDAGEAVSEEELGRLEQEADDVREKLLESHKRTAELKAGTESLQKQRAQSADSLQEQISAALEAFQEALSRQGFAHREDYEKAKRSAEQRRALQEELEAYRTKTAGNQELYRHLAETVSRKEPADLTHLMEELDILRKGRDNIVTEQKLWEG